MWCVPRTPAFSASGRPGGLLLGLDFLQKMSPRSCQGEGVLFSRRSSRTFLASTFAGFAGENGADSNESCTMVCGNLKPIQLEHVPRTILVELIIRTLARMLADPVCSWNLNGIMVWAWMLADPGCSGNTNITMAWAWMLWYSHALEHGRYYALGMDVLVRGCSWNTNVMMLWARMLWSPYALGTRTLLCFGHGCTGNRMHSEHKCHYGLGMVALVIGCNGILCRGRQCRSGQQKESKCTHRVRR